MIRWPSIVIAALVLCVVSAAAFYTYRSNQPSPGINLVLPYSRTYTGPDCFFMDMQGLLLKAFLQSLCTMTDKQLFVLEMKPNSYIRQLSMYDRKLNEVWTVPNYQGHHDISVSEARQEVFMPITAHMTLEDWKKKSSQEIWQNKDYEEFSEIRGFNFEGKEIFSWDPYDYKKDILRIAEKSAEQWHDGLTKINSIAIAEKPLEGDIKNLLPPGTIFASLDHCGAVIAIDRQSKQIVWTYKVRPGYNGGVHSVTFTADNKLLFFVNNNSPIGERSSEVLKVDPISKKILWSYSAVKPSDFTTDWGGNVTELANGNFLINNLYRAFEITPSKKVVWNWQYGQLDSEGKPIEIYRVRRISLEQWQWIK